LHWQSPAGVGHDVRLSFERILEKPDGSPERISLRLNLLEGNWGSYGKTVKIKKKKRKHSEIRVSWGV
jgi:hypothetical protein